MLRRLLIISFALLIAIAGLSYETLSAEQKKTEQKQKDKKSEETYKLKLSDPFLAKTMTYYLNIRSALVKGDNRGARVNAEQFVKAAKSTISDSDKEKSAKEKDKVATQTNIMKAAMPIADSQTGMTEARAVFGTLGDMIVDYISRIAPQSDSKQLKVYYCDISKHYWVETTDEKMANPFLGRDNPDCGEIKPGAPEPTAPGKDPFLKCEPKKK